MNPFSALEGPVAVTQSQSVLFRLNTEHSLREKPLKVEVDLVASVILASNLKIIAPNDNYLMMNY